MKWRCEINVKFNFELIIVIYFWYKDYWILLIYFLMILNIDYNGYNKICLYV